jgi:hypothetical protein
MPCHGIKDAFTHSEVRIGWFPFRAVKSTYITTAPGGGNKVCLLERGSRCGAQSVRNPDHKPNPQRRPVVHIGDKSYLWVYHRKIGKAGWVCTSDITHDPDLSIPPMKGPAQLDFEVGRTLPRAPSSSGCGEKAKGTAKERTRLVAERDLYIRYSPRGTAFAYLHRGDEVKILITNGPHGFVCVEVTKVVKFPNAIKEGRRGWVSASGLSR